MTNILDPVELTRIYKEANGELDGKARPLTTERIFAAMRAAYEAGRESNRKQVLLEAAEMYGKGRLDQPQYSNGYGDAYIVGWINGTAVYRDELRRMAEGEK